MVVHQVKAAGKVVIRWDLRVKLKGIILSKFNIMRDMKSLIKINSVVLKFFGAKIGDISFLISLIIFLKIFIFFDSLFIKGIKIRPREMKINQLVFIIDEEGSNIENKFVIIFI